MSVPFQFKEFTVAQDRCAMKIGTDGVLLGAWASLEHAPDSILDVGAGTGVIALQLAQRSVAEVIDAIEIDDDAYEQCSENFENSPWGDRLFCYHASVQEFASEMDDSYDLIISNPPFYSEDYKSNDDSRNTARFADALPFQHLIVCAAHLLSEKGRFAVVLPRKEESSFVSLAKEHGLHPNRICRVKGTSTSEEKRSLIEFSFQPSEIVHEHLTIEIERHQYTPEYVELVKDFYLKM
ncbi:methyltransferase [Aureisphaera galaxeae]|uniref:tRNA1(Val) (adenine(37)-N6)-methyltransferase n=1 Tax=Aureisphaera galaxeae TaxID=1538023 RepID=UPI00235102F9|nr:methyltransferase [Aureisphaera galaxeae]MDC8002821.1 methyltransferase [Aureisphaera galaxeae]